MIDQFKLCESWLLNQSISIKIFEKKTDFDHMVQIEVVDRDDCTLDHCGPFELDVIGQFKSKFKLEKQTERHYAIRHLKSGNLDVGETYDIQVQGFDQARNKHESMIRLRVCR